MVDKCGPNEFKCHSESHTCIPKSMVCDDIYDCADHSDEANCTDGEKRNRSKKDGPAKSAKIIGLLWITMQNELTHFALNKKQIKINQKHQQKYQNHLLSISHPTHPIEYYSKTLRWFIRRWQNALHIMWMVFAVGQLMYASSLRYVNVQIYRKVCKYLNLLISTHFSERYSLKFISKFLKILFFIYEFTFIWLVKKKIIFDLFNNNKNNTLVHIYLFATLWTKLFISSCTPHTSPPILFIKFKHIYF